MRGGGPWTTKKDFFLIKKNGRKEPEKYIKGGGQGLLQSKKYRFSKEKEEKILLIFNFEKNENVYEYKYIFW